MPQFPGAFARRPRRRRPVQPAAAFLSWPNNVASPLPDRFRSSEHDAQASVFTLADGVESRIADTTDHRYEDGEVRRYGAGESYRPFNNRDRERSPRPRSPPPRRERQRTPPIVASDSYVPGRSPRRRSRSVDRYRRERSREREGGDSWRRRDRSRSRARSPPRRSPPPRRSSPPRRSPPPRHTSPRRDDRAERARSPRRDFDARDIRRRSRSPFDRERDARPRSPMRRSPPPGPRGGGTYRPRSRSADRRDDRYRDSPYRRPSPPPRDSHPSSGITSQDVSRRSSPRPASIRGREDRSRPPSPLESPKNRSTPIPPAREPMKTTRADNSSNNTPQRSPPRGPAAERKPPTGPSGGAGRNFTAPVSSPAMQSRPSGAPSGPSVHRADMPSPTVPPAGPRGYVPTPRGGGNFGPRGGRGGWGTIPSRHNHPGPSVSPTIPPSGPTGIPTGPRSASVSSATGASPSLGSKPFNPPTGPASSSSAGPSNITTSHRPSLAQSLLNTMTPIIRGGRLDPNLSTLTTGVTKELEPHYRKLKEEEERLRDEMRAKQERLRKNLRAWGKLERDTKAFELKSELSERSLKNLAGEGLGGAAF